MSSRLRCPHRKKSEALPGNQAGVFGAAGLTTTDFSCASSVLRDGFSAADGCIVGARFVQNSSVLDRGFAFVTRDADGVLALSGKSSFVDLDSVDEAAGPARDAGGLLVAVGEALLGDELARVEVPDPACGHGQSKKQVMWRSQTPGSVVVGNTLPNEVASECVGKVGQRFLGLFLQQPEPLTPGGLCSPFKAFQPGSGLTAPAAKDCQAQLLFGIG